MSLIESTLAAGLATAIRTHPRGAKLQPVPKYMKTNGGQGKYRWGCDILEGLCGPSGTAGRKCSSITSVSFITLGTLYGQPSSKFRAAGIVPVSQPYRYLLDKERRLFSAPIRSVPPIGLLGIVLMFKGLRDFWPNFPIATVPGHWHKVHKRRFAGGNASPSRAQHWCILVNRVRLRGVIGATRLSE